MFCSQISIRQNFACSLMAAFIARLVSDFFREDGCGKIVASETQTYKDPMLTFKQIEAINWVGKLGSFAAGANMLFAC